MLTITRTALRANRRRLVGMCSAVLIGVAFLSGTLVFGDTLRAGFDEAFASSTAGTDVVVRAERTVGDSDWAGRPPLDAEVLDRVAAVDGVLHVAPSIEGVAQILGSDGEAIGGQGPPTIGANWVDTGELNPFQLAEGRAPAADDEVVIDRGSADTGGLAVGDRTTVRTPAPVEVEIVGIATADGQDSIAGSTFTAFSEDRARELFLAGEDLVTSVSVAAADGVSADELAERVAAVLPEGAEAVTGATVAAEMSEMIGKDFLDFFTMFLVVFSAIAVLVATFSIHNTFTVVLAQRLRESALLRAIGATRRQVLGSIALEALIVGVLASVIGVLAGLGLAAGLDALFGSVGMDFPGTGLVVQTDSLVIAGVVGLLVTLVAALVPAVRASRVAPLAALRDVARDTSDTSRARAVIGTVLTVAGLLLGLFGRSSMATVGIGAGLLVIGTFVVAPVIAAPAARVLGALPARLRGGSGSLARGNAARNPRRTASTATALLIGVCIVSLFTVFASSLKASLVDTLAGSITGDVVVQSEGFSGAGIGTELARELDEQPEVRAAVGFSDAPGLIGGEEQWFTAADPGAVAGVTDLGVAEGSLDDVTGESVAVSTDLADEQGWSLGDVVEVTFLDGAVVPARIAATFERPEIVGSVVVPRALAAEHMTQLRDWLVVVDAADGTSVSELKSLTAEVAERHGAPEVLDIDGFVESLAGELDALLVVVYALLALSILIALIGIGNTLSLSIHERTRELGLLRAVGQTRRQLRSMVRWESVMVATFGTLTGVLLGTFIAWSLVSALVASEGFGRFEAPLVSLAVIVVIGGLVGVLASVRPARRAARLDVLAAVAAE